jgi:toxin ParE1/3/4
MKRLRFSPRAEADLTEIWRYTAQRWGRERAERYLREAHQRLGLLRETPGLGRPCDAVRRGYLRLVVGEHLAFYRVTDTSIDIIRLLHQSMDPERHL